MAKREEQCQVAGEPSPTPQAPGRERLLVALLGLLLFVASIAIRGYHYPFGNQALQLPFVQVVRDPSLYPHDPLVATLSAYCSWYWVAVAHLGGDDPAGLLLALYLLTNMGRLLAAAWVAHAMFPQSRLAPWAAAALWAMGPRPLMDAGTLMSPYAEQSATAVVFLLWAFQALLGDRPLWWALCFAAGFLLNPMYGVYAATYFGLVALVLLAKRSLSVGWLWAAGAAGVLVVPSVIWSVRTMHGLEGGTAADVILWVQVAEARLAGHLFPLRWEWLSFVWHTLVLIGVIAGLRYAADLGERTKALVGSAVVASVGWLGLAFAAAYLVRVPRLLALHPARGMDLYYALAGLFLTGLMVRRLEREHQAGRDLLWPLLGLLGAMGIWLAYPQWMVGAMALLGGVVALARPLWAGWLRRLTVAQMRTGLCLLVGGLALAMVLGRCAHGEPLVFAFYQDRAAADAARWATTHTPREAAFLVDPAADGYFRPLSRRPVFITSLDCAGILWSIGYAGEYTRRMADLGHDPRRVFGRPPVGLLRRLGDEGLLRLAAKYGLSYAVLDLAQPTRLPVVYRNSRLQIVALSLPLPATTPPATAPRAP